MLRLENLEVYYGDAQALSDVSLAVEPGSIVALIGANGAGKSTALKTVAGLIRPRSGTIEYQGQDISALSPQAIVDLGISMVPEDRRLFTRMTVRENLEMGAYARRSRPGFRESLDRVLALFPALHQRLREPAGVLSGGQQQMLAIGRALMSQPKLLMLDEPSLGLAPLVVKMMFQVVATLRDQGVTILLVEQNVRRSLELSDAGYVINTGQVTLHGSSKELLADQEVREAFLGIRGVAL